MARRNKVASILSLFFRCQFVIKNHVQVNIVKFFNKSLARYFKELQDRNDELEARLHGGVADRGR